MTSEFTPRRVVSLQPSATVILAAIGKLEPLVGCTKYCAEVCPEVLQGGRTIVADSWTASTEEIARLCPDLVIAAVPYQEKAVAEILKAGVRFLGLAPKALNDVYGDIAIISGVMDAAERGQQVADDMRQEIGAVRAKTRSLVRRKVYCEEWGKPLIASQPWVAELVEAAGGEFVGQAGRQTTVEAVAKEDPEVVVAAWCGAGDRVPLEKIVRERGWEQIKAARERRVYCVRDELLNTPAPTLIEGLRALAAAIHPEEFPAPPGLRRMG